jgi:hypothetical protein
VSMGCVRAVFLRRRCSPPRRPAPPLLRRPMQRAASAPSCASPPGRPAALRAPLPRPRPPPRSPPRASFLFSRTRLTSSSSPRPPAYGSVLEQLRSFLFTSTAPASWWL